VWPLLGAHHSTPISNQSHSVKRSLLQIQRANKPRPGGLEVAGLSILKKAGEWLTDDGWIVLCFYSGFIRHLETMLFTPGTPKSAEFEIMAAQ
jgi:hypothetical protein